MLADSINTFFTDPKVYTPVMDNALYIKSLAELEFFSQFLFDTYDNSKHFVSQYSQYSVYVGSGAFYLDGLLELFIFTKLAKEMYDDKDKRNLINYSRFGLTGTKAGISISMGTMLATKGVSALSLLSPFFFVFVGVILTRATIDTYASYKAYKKVIDDVYPDFSIQQSLFARGYIESLPLTNMQKAELRIARAKFQSQLLGIGIGLVFLGAVFTFVTAGAGGPAAMLMIAATLTYLSAKKKIDGKIDRQQTVLSGEDSGDDIQQTSKGTNENFERTHGEGFEEQSQLSMNR
ncbi:MAG: hypothetical protein ACE365_01615 [Gammaproteobacteria bacterium]